MKTLAFFTLFELAAACAWGNTLLEYESGPFRLVSGIYQTTDRITGSLLLGDLGPLQGAGPNRVTEAVIAWSFSDGHQTLTEQNSVGLFDLPPSSFLNRLAPPTRDWGVFLYAPDSVTPVSRIFAGDAFDEWQVGAVLGPDAALDCAGGIGCVGPSVDLEPGQWRATAVPEPATLTLLGIGCVGLVLARRWRR